MTMPFDAPLALPPIAPVRASAAIELSWLTISCKDKVAHRLAPELDAEVNGFWGDGDGMLTEILVIAQQLGCLTGWNIDPLLSVATATLAPDAEMNLATEPPRERALVRERIRRLAGDAQLRARYQALPRRVWAEGEPLIAELGRPTVERAARYLKLLSDPTRVLILTELDRTPATVGEIAERVGVAQPTASVHVRQLREAGILRATRDGASSTYTVDRTRVREAPQSAHEALLPALSATES